MHITSKTTFQPTPVADGRVDEFALAGFAQDRRLLTDIQDPVVQDIVSVTGSKDGAKIGPEWEGRYADLPIWGNRGMNGLKQWSTFKAPGQQLVVDWHARTVTLDTEGPQAGKGHRVSANFDWGKKLLPNTIAESTYDIRA